MKRLRRPPRSFTCLLGAGLLFSVMLPALADDARDAAIDQDMARMKTAMQSKDEATLVDMMYEPIVQAGGGRDQVLAQAKSLADKVDFTSFEINKPYRYFSGQQNDYVTVPTHLLMTINGHHFDSVSFELGIKAHQTEKWEYVDGAGISPQLRTQLFPDLPQDAVLPEHSVKQID
ncbi:MAG: hypothetical protein LV481_02490 [Methylacidiphilales bacterium]|nr:hypothetical protein [Candidatus Methylacidiphilales bacterium]